jgi:tetratricopeptide (TPR) repeat protein
MDRALLRNTRQTERGAKQFPVRLVVRAASFAPLRNTRKTECGACRFLTSFEVRAAPFALLKISRHTDCGAKQCLIRLVVRAASFALLSIFFVRTASAQNAAPISRSAAIAKNNEAACLSVQGREAEAEKLYLAALGDGYDDDLARAKIANNLGWLYQRQDRYREAERWFRCALQSRQKSLPADSLEVAYSFNNLAEIYRIEGRYWEARNLMETAVRNLQQSHTDAPGLPIILSNFAMVLCRFKEFDDAEHLLRTALASYQKLGKDLSREYAVTLNNLGQALEGKHELAAAVPPYQQAIGVLQQLGVSARSDLAATLANAGELYRRLDRIEDARQAEAQALALLRPGGDALLRAQILRTLGNIMAGAGNPSDSLPYFEQSLDLQEKTLGEEHPATASLLLDYSSATLRAGNKSLSRKLRKRATELLERLKSRSPGQMTVSVRALRAAQ